MRERFYAAVDMKLIKYGILNRTVCQSKTSYICNFKLYSGKGGNLQNGITEILVSYLRKYLCWQFYNSVDVARYLNTMRGRVYATARINGGLPVILR